MSCSFDKLWTCKLLHLLFTFARLISSICISCLSYVLLKLFFRCTQHLLAGLLNWQASSVRLTHKKEIMLRYLRITLKNGKSISKHWRFKTKWHLEHMVICEYMLHGLFGLLVIPYKRKINRHSLVLPPLLL